jgi:hypothetical protein
VKKCVTIYGNDRERNKRKDNYLKSKNSTSEEREARCVIFFFGCKKILFYYYGEGQ